MAVIPEQLPVLARQIRDAIDELVTEINNEWNTGVIDWFNSSWCSNNAKLCLGECKTAIDAVWGDYKRAVAAHSEAIKSVVANENAGEAESSSFPGVEAPDLNLSETISDRLPGGRLGKDPTKDITDLTKNVNKIRDMIIQHTENVSSVIKGHAETFDINISEALSASYSDTKTDFTSTFETLASTAATRFNNEEEARDEMNDTNVANMDIRS